MTKDEVIERAKLMNAWAKQGVKIQYFSTNKNDWCDCPENQPTWNIYVTYRIKPEAKIRPYNWIEFQAALRKHGNFVHLKASECRYIVNYYDYTGVGIYSHTIITYKEFFDKFTWADDDSPCGILEK